MQPIQPMDRFINDFGRSLNQSEKIAEEMDPMSFSDVMEYGKSQTEVKLMAGAVSNAIDARYGMLKMVMSSIK